MIVKSLIILLLSLLKMIKNSDDAEVPPCQSMSKIFIIVLGLILINLVPKIQISYKTF